MRPKGQQSGHTVPVELSLEEVRRIAVRAQGFVGQRSGSDASRPNQSKGEYISRPLAWPTSGPAAAHGRVPYIPTYP